MSGSQEQINRVALAQGLHVAALDVSKGGNRLKTQVGEALLLSSCPVYWQVSEDPLPSSLSRL